MSLRRTCMWCGWIDFKSWGRICWLRRQGWWRLQCSLICNIFNKKNAWSLLKIGSPKIDPASCSQKYLRFVFKLASQAKCSSLPSKRKGLCPFNVIGFHSNYCINCGVLWWNIHIKRLFSSFQHQSSLKILLSRLVFQILENQVELAIVRGRKKGILCGHFHQETSNYRIIRMKTPLPWKGLYLFGGRSQTDKYLKKLKSLKSWKHLSSLPLLLCRKRLQLFRKHFNKNKQKTGVQCAFKVVIICMPIKNAEHSISHATKRQSALHTKSIKRCKIAYKTAEASQKKKKEEENPWSHGPFKWWINKNCFRLNLFT